MLKILIVDDEVIFRERLRSTIEWEHLGFTICAEARNGLEALAKIESAGPDIVLADINMPVMDGLTLAERIAENHAGIKIILITGHSEFEYARKAVKTGVADYILKPLEKEELLRTLIKIKNDRQEALKQVNLLESGGQVLKERFLDTLASSKCTRSKRIAEDAVQYILGNYSDKELTAEKVAHNVFIAPSHLRHVFKKETGQTVVDYITKVRMQKARELLAEGTMKLSEISDAIGYADSGYFSKCFKKFHGISPSDFENTVK